jgi:RNA polymerase sigma factor (sigma-70 family)
MPQAGQLRDADLELVARVIAGERAAVSAFDRLLERAAAAGAARAAARWRGLRLDPADLRQALHVMLLQDGRRLLRTYEGRAALATWLHTIATRQCHHEAARRSGEEARRGADAPLEDLADGEDDPEAASARRQQVVHVRAALAELPDDDRALLRLLVDEEAPAAAVAGALGITPDGVRMRKMRVLRRLRERLAVTLGGLLPTKHDETGPSDPHPPARGPGAGRKVTPP